MRFLATSLPGFTIIELTVQTDERGFFAETFRADALHEAGIRETWA